MALLHLKMTYGCNSSKISKKLNVCECALPSITPFVWGDVYDSV